MGVPQPSSAVQSPESWSKELERGPMWWREPVVEPFALGTWEGHGSLGAGVSGDPAVSGGPLYEVVSLGQMFSEHRHAHAG